MNDHRLGPALVPPRRLPRALALLACFLLIASRASGAGPRFGDSTWVAPSITIDGDPSADGPRVAPPDHRRLWESALRAPFRVAFFPLRLVARGAEEGVGHFGDQVMAPGGKPPARGLKVSPEIDLGGVTEVGLGPTFSWVGFPSHDSSLRLGGTWSTTDRRQVRLVERTGDRRPISFRLRGDYDRKPNLKFYGIGNETPSSDHSVFLLESTSGEGALLFGRLPLRQLRLVGGYSAMTPDHGYQGRPVLEDVFAPGTLPYDHQATQELLYGVTGDLAILDSGSDPSIGVHGRGELRRAAGLRDRDPDYNQWLFEARAYAPVFAKRRVMAVRMVYTGIDPTGGATTIPFYRLIQSDGLLRFAGYPSHRFRDRQLMLGRIEYRWEVWRQVRALALYELGEVAPRTSAFTARATHWSYGGGFRYGLSDESTLRLEIAKSTEGFQGTLAIQGGF